MKNHLAEMLEEDKENMESTVEKRYCDLNYPSWSSTDFETVATVFYVISLCYIVEIYW